MENLKKTALYEIHKSLGARMVPFAGWIMPIQYSGLIDEHRTVRESAGIFDVSHMGEIEIIGPHALDIVQRVTTNDASRLQTGHAQYTLLCYPNGGIVDDALVYKLSDDRYLFCVNAGNTDKDFEWIRDNTDYKLRAEVRNVSDRYAQLALQGPKAAAILDKITDEDVNNIPCFCFEYARIGDAEGIVSRTGYTGEDGFEIYIAPDRAVQVWEEIMEIGREFGLKPIGLGARDTLRMEMKYPLYGNDIDAETTPLEANLGWAVKYHKRDFIGKEALVKQSSEGVERKLVCIEMMEKGIPRQGYEIRLDGRKVGVVTSGTMSPSLKKGIAIGYVDAALDKKGQELDIIIRGNAYRSIVVAPPFYKKNR